MWQWNRGRRVAGDEHGVRADFADCANCGRGKADVRQGVGHENATVDSAAKPETAEFTPIAYPDGAPYRTGDACRLAVAVVDHDIKVGIAHQRGAITLTLGQRRTGG